jgi:antitoxin YefM
MQSFTIQEAQDKLSTLIDDVAQGHLPIAISSDLNDAVLISKADWDAIQETLYLNQIPNLVNSLHGNLLKILFDLRISNGKLAGNFIQTSS